MINGWPSRDLLSHRQRTTPKVTAVIDAVDGTEQSYKDLNTTVAATAARVNTDIEAIDGGDRPKIGIVAEPSPDFMIALFAAWRVEAIAVPLSTTDSMDDRQNQLDRLNLSLAIEYGHGSFADVDLYCPVLSVNSTSASRVTDNALASKWHPDETALILFTSGTTDRPKGVRLTHGNLVASATSSAFRLGVETEDRWHVCLPPNHMGGLAPIVRTTLYGASVIFERGFDVTETGERMTSHSATGVSLVPTMLRRLLDRGWTPHKSLRFVLCGGAPTPPSLVRRAKDADVPIYPTYGTTETASQIATATPAEAAANPSKVGSPLVTAEITIVDPDGGNPVKPGEVGELVVDGPIVSPGYLDAKIPESEVGLHTGDLASRDHNGRLEIHGRLDDAVQTGGETVHPARVTEALHSISGIREATVVGVPDTEWGERVVALIVEEDDETVMRESIQEALGEKLAPYELPKAIETVDTLPRTASGTINRDAVKEHFLD